MPIYDPTVNSISKLNTILNTFSTEDLYYGHVYSNEPLLETLKPNLDYELLNELYYHNLTVNNQPYSLTSYFDVFNITKDNIEATFTDEFDPISSVIYSISADSYENEVYNVTGKQLKKTKVVVPVTIYEFETKSIVSGRVN